MKLNDAGLKKREAWESRGYDLPAYDRETVRKETRENPFWIHFGGGNIFRAFQANVVQNLLNQGILDRGLVVAEGFDYEIIRKMYHPHDDLSILVTLKAAGTIEKTVVGSVMESLELDSENEARFARLQEIFCKDSLQMASFTIMEKGYSLVSAGGELLPAVQSDLKNGPEKPASYMGKVASLLYTRYCCGRKPVAMVSMDNCSHNGDRLKAAITAFAEGWVKNQKADPGFEEYVKGGKLVSFPWSMIDKITPRPNGSVEEALAQDGIDDLAPVITGMKSYVAPFVNAEETEYLVVEDDFPNGRPQLEKGGIIFTDRETVDKVEKMKVCTCLNPLHTALAVFGCLLGYDLIAKEMQDEDLKKLVERIGYQEGLPVVVNPGILDPGTFIDTVLKVRFPNPFMPDTPQRIATDTSQKLAIRYGETIKAYLASDELNIADLKLIPLVQAGWLRYMMGIDDNGNTFELSPDPLHNTIRPILEKVTLGGTQDAADIIAPILHDGSIFGLDLYEAGLAGKVCSYFNRLITGPGAVRRTLHEAVTENC